jgi:hypothetical protein
MSQTKEQIQDGIVIQLLNQNVSNLVASLADATLQIREKDTRISELENQLSPKPDKAE